MTIKSCVLIKPHPSTSEGREQQERHIKNLIGPAIRQANLELVGDEAGCSTDDVTPVLIRQVYEADIVVVDANCYETGSVASFSPFLYYFIALRHTLGNQTILVSQTTDHLPHSLRKHHTLSYQPDESWQFYQQFMEVVQAIRSGEDQRPDNPIQEYLQELEYRAKEEELARTQRMLAAREAQLEALQKEKKIASQPKITFRPVN